MKILSSISASLCLLALFFGLGKADDVTASSAQAGGKNATESAMKLYYAVQTLYNSYSQIVHTQGGSDETKIMKEKDNVTGALTTMMDVFRSFKKDDINTNLFSQLYNQYYYKPRDDSATESSAGQ